MQKVQTLSPPLTNTFLSAAGQAQLVFQRVTNHPLFNQLSGFLPAGYFLLLVMAEGHDLLRLLEKPLATTEAEVHIFAAAAATIGKMLFMSLIAVLFLIRKPPIRKAPGVQPRLTAMAGTFLLMAIVLLPTPEATLWQSLLGLGLVAIGSAFSVVAIGYLGRSFSIMAEARELVTRGVYSHIRHPLYLAEEVAVIGAIVIYFSPPAILLLLIHIALQIQRMRNEESVLGQTFPEYEAYKARTARVIPRIY